MPSFLAGVDGDAMIDEPSSDGAFHFADPTIEGFSVLNERSELAVRFGGHVDRLELAHSCHAGEFESIVLVGFAFDITPLPSVFVGGADESFVAKADGKVVDPAGGTAGFHDDEVAFGFFEKRGEVGAFGCGIDELMFSRF